MCRKYLQQRRSKEGEKKLDKKRHDGGETSVRIVNRTSFQSSTCSRDSVKPGTNRLFGYKYMEWVIVQYAAVCDYVSKSRIFKEKDTLFCVTLLRRSGDLSFPD